MKKRETYLALYNQLNTGFFIVYDESKKEYYVKNTQGYTINRQIKSLSKVKRFVSIMEGKPQI